MTRTGARLLPLPNFGEGMKMRDFMWKQLKSTKYFKLTNPNPNWEKQRGLVWNIGDCVVRALALAVGCSWLEAFDYLTAKARKDFSVINDIGSVRRWFVEDGAKWVALKAEKGVKRMTVEKFAEAHPIGCYILDIANHLTACVNGVVLDAWNPASRCVYGYFDMTKFKLI